MESQVTVLAPGITRLRAANPSPMTGSGTNTYVLQGAAACVVIDPGPALPAHQAAILRACDTAPVAAILLSHAHLDHSGLCDSLRAATGAQVLSFGDARSGRSAAMQRLADDGMTGGGEGIDQGFAPDRHIADGEVLSLGDLQVEVLHCPGHMGGHLCFALGDLAFTGDHVMGWASTLVSPPDGDMRAYMASLAKLATRPWAQFFPGHGEVISTPAARLSELKAHRLARESAILAALKSAAMTPAELAARIYTDTPAALLGAAQRNILAHLIDLHERSQVESDDLPGPATRFHLI
jgi:glyoxylase-like metal-dependent hydrolase (beta-lactamase superfamily II)